jgi:hypothetical protein
VEFRTQVRNANQGGKVTEVDAVNHTAKVQFSVVNYSTIESATHPPVIGYTQWWGTNIGKPLNNYFSTGPMSKFKQTFNWTETIEWYAPRTKDPTVIELDNLRVGSGYGF